MLLLSCEIDVTKHPTRHKTAISQKKNYLAQNMISPRLRTSVLSNGHVATVVKRLKSRWSIYHSHVFRIILIGVMLHFRCSHINHWEITLYACGYLVISDILFPLISRPTDFLVILLLFLWKSICSLPTGFSLFYSLSPTSNTVPPSSFFTWFHILSQLLHLQTQANDLDPDTSLYCVLAIS